MNIQLNLRRHCSLKLIKAKSAHHFIWSPNSHKQIYLYKLSFQEIPTSSESAVSPQDWGAGRHLLQDSFSESVSQGKKSSTNKLKTGPFYLHLVFQYQLEQLLSGMTVGEENLFLSGINRKNKVSTSEHADSWNKLGCVHTVLDFGQNTLLMKLKWWRSQCFNCSIVKSKGLESQGYSYFYTITTKVDLLYVHRTDLFKECTNCIF